MIKNNNHKRGIMVGVIVAFLLVVTLGVTFAIWNYSRTTDNQVLVTGDIYMKYTGTNQINAPGMLPIDINKYYSEDGEYIPKPVEYKYTRNASMTSEELSSCESYFNAKVGWFQNDETSKAFCEGTGTVGGGQDTFQEALDNGNLDEDLEELKSRNIIKEEIAKEYPAIPYFEFKIEGVNNYSKDIWYEIVLKDGNPPTDEPKRTERLRDDLLRFRLVEVVGEEEQEIFTNRGYEDISDERIYVNTIGANTTEKITRTYRLYMWISSTTRIGVGDNIDYDMETWNDKVYASVKINVAGDFNEKEVNYNQPAYCFATEEFQNNGKTEVMITDYDRSCGTDVVIPSKINGHEVTVIGDSGGYNEGYIMPIGAVPNASFTNKNLTSVVIPNTVRIIGSFAFSNNNLTQVEIPDSVTWIDYEAFSDNPLEEVKVGSGIEYIEEYAFNAEIGLDGYSKFQRLEVKKTCDVIKNIPVKDEDYLEDKYYPWTDATHKDGLKVYGYQEGQITLCDTLVKRQLNT